MLASLSVLSVFFLELVGGPRVAQYIIRIIQYVLIQQYNTIRIIHYTAQSRSYCATLVGANSTGQRRRRERERAERQIARDGARRICHSSRESQTRARKKKQTRKTRRLPRSAIGEHSKVSDFGAATLSPPSTRAPRPDPRTAAHPLTAGRPLAPPQAPQLLLPNNKNG